MSRVEIEPPSSSSHAAQPHFIVGQDPDGRWLAIETHNLGGGVFKSREDALHFVGFETGRRPAAFDLATAPLHLRF